mmetsp:Transcript_3749/g.9473  ORF Transcript_3749/g.9473 Transcript_3749/m.9473 type:complete len:233 (-) Transcript_3749:601-1299(-)
MRIRLCISRRASATPGSAGVFSRLREAITCSGVSPYGPRSVPRLTCACLRRSSNSRIASERKAESEPWSRKAAPRSTDGSARIGSRMLSVRTNPARRRSMSLSPELPAMVLSSKSASEPCVTCSRSRLTRVLAMFHATSTSNSPTSQRPPGKGRVVASAPLLHASVSGSLSFSATHSSKMDQSETLSVAHFLLTSWSSTSITPSATTEIVFSTLLTAPLVRFRSPTASMCTK